MDKETLSNYGWIVICVLVLAVMLALATPFGTFVADAIKSTTQGLFDVNQNALNSTGLINIGDQSFGEGGNGGNGGAGDQGGTNTLPEVGKTAEEYTWAEIKAISEADKGDEYFNLGDTKTFTTTDGKTIVMEIVAFNADTKADGTGTAGITWMSRGVIVQHRMNASNTSANGWEVSELRSWLKSDFYSTLPNDITGIIVSVNKTYYDYTSKSTKSCADNVWIPSYREVFGNSTNNPNYETSGVDYTTIFKDTASRIKYQTVTGSSIAVTWYLRSADYNDNRFFCRVHNSGVSDVIAASGPNGVVLGFCT